MVPRRALLRALGVSVAVGAAGCNDSADGDGTPTQPPTETPRATPTATLTPTRTKTPTRTPGSETPAATPTPSGPERAETPALTRGTSVDRFGRSVALSQEAAIVLAAEGGAYAFTADDGWADPVVLAPNEGDGFGGHGASAALVGTLAVLGGPSAGPDPNTGAAYLFERTADGWVQRHQFSPDGEEDTNEFGRSIAFDGVRVVVGDANDPSPMVERTGRAYVFSGDGTDWAQDATLGTGAEDFFGTSVAVDGDVVLVGAVHAEVDGERSGAVYVYERSDGAWQRQARLAPDDPSRVEGFGQSVALDGDTAVVGAPLSGEGRAYVFDRAGGDWVQQGRLTVRGLDFGADFGQSVAIADGSALVGAPNAGETGRAYVFEAAAEWALSRRLAAADLPENAEFGFDVTQSGDTVLVGAPAFRNTTGAYLFDL